MPFQISNSGVEIDRTPRAQIVKDSNGKERGTNSATEDLHTQELEWTKIDRESDIPKVLIRSDRVYAQEWRDSDPFVMDRKKQLELREVRILLFE